MVDECLIDVIKSMNTIIKDERAKIEKFRDYFCFFAELLKGLSSRDNNKSSFKSV